MNPQTALVLVCLLGSSLSLPMHIGILASNSNEIFRLNGLNGLTLATQMQMRGNPFLQQFLLPDMGLTPINFNPQMTGTFGQQIPQMAGPFGQQIPQMTGPFVQQIPQLTGPFGQQIPQLTGPFGQQIPQMTGPFGQQLPQLLVPTQGNQLTPVILPNGQQEQIGAQDPMVPQQPQNPMQVVPQYNYPYGFPQQPGMQGYPYYMSPYGYPQQRTPMMLQPNRQVPVGQPQLQTLDRTTQKPQLPLQQAAQPKGQADKTLPTGTQSLPATPPPDNRGDTAGPGVDEGQSNFPFLFEP